MKKAYKQLRAIDKLISEAIESANNINGWAVSESEKQNHRDKYDHWLGELQESRIKALNRLKEVVELELKDNAKAA